MKFFKGGMLGEWNVGIQCVNLCMKSELLVLYNALG
jgi:hypothetical protein